MNLQIVLIIASIILVVVVFFLSKSIRAVELSKSSMTKIWSTLTSHIPGHHTHAAGDHCVAEHTKKSNRDSDHVVILGVEDMVATKSEQIDMFESRSVEIPQAENQCLETQQTDEEQNQDFDDLDPFSYDDEKPDYVVEGKKDVFDDQAVSIMDIDDDFSEITPSLRLDIDSIRDQEISIPLEDIETNAKLIGDGIDVDLISSIDHYKQQSGKYCYPRIEGFQKIRQIDYWVRLYGGRDIGRESILAQYQGVKMSSNNVTGLYGVRVSDEQWADVEKEMEEVRFNDLIITIQLVNEGIATDESQLFIFVQTIKKLAEKTNRQVGFMATLDNALNQAQAIEDFIRYFNSLFIVNVVPQEKTFFDGVSLARCVVQLGLEQTPHNTYGRNKKVRGGNICSYHLSNMTDTGEFDFDRMEQFTTKGVMFSTNPAMNRSPGAVFTEMVNTAKSFASRLKGTAMIPGYEDLTQDVVDDIRSLINDKAEEMKESGLDTGSDEAIRIF